MIFTYQGIKVTAATQPSFSHHAVHLEVNKRFVVSPNIDTLLTAMDDHKPMDDDDDADKVERIQSKYHIYPRILVNIVQRGSKIHESFEHHVCSAAGQPEQRHLGRLDVQSRHEISPDLFLGREADGWLQAELIMLRLCLLEMVVLRRAAGRCKIIRFLVIDTLSHGRCGVRTNRGTRIGISGLAFHGVVIFH